MTLSAATHPKQRRGYSLAMIARLVDVPASTVRRWVRRGYLSPLDARDRMASFGFEEVRVAKTLANMAHAGLSPSRIDRVVEQLCCGAAPADRVLADKEISVDGDSVLVHDQGELSEPSGQLLLRFDLEHESPHTQGQAIPFPEPEAAEPLVELESLRSRAEELLELGELNQAEEACRAVLFSGHATAADHLALADTLYRRGELTAARERYLVCLELDEHCLDARLSLGSLYAELGSLQLASSALEGVLEMAPDAPDALMQLADLNDRLGKPEEACRLRRRLVGVAPEGPWSEQARARLAAAAPAEQLEIPRH